jgi:pilus assembly protein Flp/PilA
MLQMIITHISGLRSDRRAVTALEYGLIASLVAVAIITAVTNLGAGLTNTFAAITAKLQ